MTATVRPGCVPAPIDTSRAQASAVRSLWPVVWLALTSWLVLAFPGHPADVALDAFVVLPLELPLLVAGAVLGIGWRGRVFRLTIVTVAIAALTLRLANIGSRLAFDRDFSPLTEWHLLGHGWTLAAKTIGREEALVLVGAVLVSLMLVAVVLWRALRRVQRIEADWRRPVATVAFALFLTAGVGMLAELPGVRATLIPDLVARVRAIGDRVIDQREFERALGFDPVTTSAYRPAFAALADRDVVVVFIESYGRSYLTTEPYATRAANRLSDIEERLVAAGLSSASGWVDSPTRGGRSWLAHATLAGGVDVTNHTRFDRLIASERRSLWSLFGAAGWSTAVVLPVVDGPWREGPWYGVDRFFDRRSLGYAGRDFGYVTMPDQYTLEAFQRRVRETADAPLAAEIGLIGSHAPWTPLPVAVPWEQLGDGALFDGTRRFGGPLDWRDPAPVRHMYAESIDLTLRMIGEYLERHGQGALFVLIGDHQPATVIAGWSRDYAVPIHVVADDPRLLDRLPSKGFVSGMTPSAQTLPLPMSTLRTWLGHAFERPLAEVAVAES